MMDLGAVSGTVSRMSGNQTGTQRELLAEARKQLAWVTKEFQLGLSTVKDPVQRRRLADAYTQLMHRYVTKVRASVGTHNDVPVIVDDSADVETRKSKTTGKAVAAVTGLGVAAVSAVRAIGRSRDGEQVTVAPPETAVPLSETAVDPPARSVLDPPPATTRTEDL